MFIGHRKDGVKYDLSGNPIYTVFEQAIRHRDWVNKREKEKPPRLRHPYKILMDFASVAGHLFCENNNENPYRHPAILVMLRIIGTMYGINIVSDEEYNKAFKICSEKAEVEMIPNLAYQPTSDAYIAAHRAYKRFLGVSERMNNELSDEECEARGWCKRSENNVYSCD